MDPDVRAKIQALMVNAHLESEQINSALWDNVTQGTAVIGNNLLQQLGGPSAVPGLIASAQAAARSPAQGML